MKKLLLLLAGMVFGLGLIPASAQNYNFNIGGLQYASGPSVPGACSRGGSYFYKNTSTKGWYVCNGSTYDALATGSSSGTVTSASFIGGLISVATPTSTPAFTVAGTSGGIPFFDSASTWSTSAALTANRLVLGGGAGAAPSVLGSLGTTTTVLHGNAAGAPSFAAVTSSDIDSTIQPTANPTFTGTVTLPTVTNTGAFNNSFAGAASTPGMTITGIPFAGTGTTSTPQIYLFENGASVPTTWSTAGTFLGIQDVSGFNGNFIDFKHNGSTVFSVSKAGAIVSGNVITIAGNGSFIFSGGALWTTGAGTPEGAVTGKPGSLFSRTDGGAATTLYVKESGTGNTGWVAK